MSDQVSFAALRIACANQVQMRTAVSFERALELVGLTLISGLAMPFGPDAVMDLARRAIDRAEAVERVGSP